MLADAIFPHAGWPEWQRIGRFFVLATALHLALLCYPLKAPFDTKEPVSTDSLRVTLIEQGAAPQEVTPPAPRKPASNGSNSNRERTVQKPRPAAVMPTAPTTFSAVAGEQAPVLAPTVAPVQAASSALATISPPRFDVAYLHNPRPSYPPLSRRLGEEGKVQLRVRVSPDGQPAAVDLEKSSNFERLDEAARAVVARWRFVPARRGDEAIEATVIVPIVFRLDS